MERLTLLLGGDDAFDDDDIGVGRANDRPFENDTGLDDNAMLRSYLSELSSRQNLDFSDQLWQLIIGSSDYAEMTDCIHAVFEKIVENNYKPQVYYLLNSSTSNFSQEPQKWTDCLGV